MSKTIWSVLLVGLGCCCVVVIPAVIIALCLMWESKEDKLNYYNDNHKSFRSYDGKEINKLNQ